MRVLEVQWSQALSLVYEVALKQVTKPGAWNLEPQFGKLFKEHVSNCKCLQIAGI